MADIAVETGTKEENGVALAEKNSTEDGKAKADSPEPAGEQAKEGGTAKAVTPEPAGKQGTEDGTANADTPEPAGEQGTADGTTENAIDEQNEVKLRAKREVSEKNREAAECLGELKGGSTVQKVTRRRSTSDRFLQFEDDELKISKVEAPGESEKKKYRISKSADSPKQKKGSSFLCGLGSGSENLQVHVSQIAEVRDGPLTDRFDKSFKKLGIEEDRCFSVIQKGLRQKTVDIIAPDKSTKDKWVKGLKYVIKARAGADAVTKQENWMKDMFRKADKSGDQALTVKEVCKLLKDMSMDVDKDNVKEEFTLVQEETLKTKKGEECLNLQGFVDFFHKLTQRPEVEELFEKYSYDDGHTLDTHELKDFFSKEQNQDLSAEEISKLVQMYETSPDCKKQNVMSLCGFNTMLQRGEIMRIIKPEYKKVYMNMDQPISDYFINSSHNTYLTGDQLVGDSSVESYIRAFEQGCRCVELDCWDGDHDEPVIYHGHTMTSKIKFKDVVEAVNVYAFKASQYPVVLSLENHCSIGQQKVMAKYLTSILGKKLYTTQLPDDATELPSPESLKGKFLIKNKKLREVKDNDDDNVMTDDDEDMDNDTSEISALKKKPEGSKVKIAAELSNLVVIFQSVKFHSFQESIDNYNFKQMSAIGENKAFGLADHYPMEFIKHNQFQVTRTYPAGTRVDSSNYDPMPMWLTGNQLVALNYQTPDRPMQVYRGRFEDNGKCGYVLKPDILTKADSTFNVKGPYPDEWKKILKLKVISGFQLPKKAGDKTRSILDPYVIVRVAGVEADNMALHTEQIHNNGFHPVWNAEMSFGVNVPQMAIVHIRVMDYETRLGTDLLDKDEAVAEYSLPFTCLQTGYRTVALRTPKGVPIWGASLLVHVDIS